MGKEAEIQLPEAIIQHIQSFMTGKEAARTTILSKSWYSAWSIRPNLDFDQRDFVMIHCDLGDVKGFWKFVKKTVQRYEKFNLKIESLSLWIHGTCSVKAKHCCFSLADELIVKAITMGAIDLSFNINRSNSEFALPREVFGSENLIRLSVSGCKIDGKVRCWRLKYLSLDRMWVEGDIIWDIISSCHLIEELSLSGSRFLFETQSYTSNDVSITSTSSLALSPFIEFGRRNVGSVIDGSINLYKFQKLKCLFLDRVNVHTLFFNEFSSKFPCLKVLGLYDCDGYKGIQISSPSLERINFIQRRMLRAKFDVPSIRKFTFTGKHVPSLSFETAPSNWESDIAFTCLAPPNVTWFLRLNKLLTKLSQSRVSLSLKILLYPNFNLVGKFQALFKPVVENLTINVPLSVCPALFDILFECCHPVFATQRMPGQCDVEEVRKNDILVTLHKRFIQQGTLTWYKTNQSRCGPCDLEEVAVELFDEAVCRPTSLGAEQRIRLRLRWGREPAILK